VQAPAKINLTLEILARRDDGYHALRSVMVPIGLRDELAFAPAPAFTFACDPPALGDGNLVTRAFAQLGLANAPVAVTLRKYIPVGAGLGGGSSDAAAVLLAAMRGDFGPLAPRDWVADARALGSDVPFFLVDGPALVEGTGERVTALGSAPPWWAVVVMPPVSVATAAAYGALAAARADAPAVSRPRSESASIRCGEALQRADYDATLAAMTNDFEALVARDYPPVRATLDALAAAGADRALLSGSGAACFTLARDERSARAVAQRLPEGGRVHVVALETSLAWR
jgi:4-diphosphocytidyl-2-C-methyl-D-erythritol kinase